MPSGKYLKTKDKKKSRNKKMKATKKLSIITLGLSLALFILSGFVGCSQDSPLSPVQLTGQNETGSLAKITFLTNQFVENILDEMSVSKTATFFSVKNCYNGVTLPHPNGSILIIERGSLTPPADIAWGDPVEISIIARKNLNKKEIEFTFGTSGCHFEPAATVWLCWEELGLEQADLYYIDDDGNYIKQLPEDVDVKNKRLKLSIPHFSRYAVAFSR
jgi:hypothetical protein